MQKTLIANLIPYSFGCRDSLPLRPDTLWRIEQGAARTLTWNEEGAVVTLGYWGSGDVLGQPLSHVQPYQIECLTFVKASCIPLHQEHRLLETICRQVQQMETLLQIVRSERIGERLQQLLGWLAVKFGRQVNQGQLIDLRLTHQELAEVVGTTRVTVTRLLNQFEREGIISRPHRHFIILNDR